MPMPILMKIIAESQGEITTGMSNVPGEEDYIMVQGFDHECTRPTDVQSGQPTGKRFHTPLTITKTIDKTTPLLLVALCTGEKLTDVELNFKKIDPAGKEVIYYVIKLQDAIVTNIKAYMPDCMNKELTHYTHMENISFTYRKIIWEEIIEGTSGEDDWEAPNM